MSTRRPQRLASTLAAGVLLACAASVCAVAWGRSSHFDASNLYSYGTATCTSRKGPTNVVFYKKATEPTAKALLLANLPAWSNTTGPLAQTFKSHTDCGAQAWQQATAAYGQNRFHIRARHTYHADAVYGTIVVGSARYEQRKTCGNVVKVVVKDPLNNNPSGWDIGRDTITAALLPLGGVLSSNPGNSATVYSSCGASPVQSQSDGWVDWYRVN